MGLSHQTQIGADWLTQSNAHQLARSIHEYWIDRGYRVEVWVEKVPRADSGQFNTDPVWQVRSDLINGLPRDYRDGGLDGGRLRRL